MENIFEVMNKMCEDHTVNMSFKKKNGKLTVSLIPVLEKDTTSKKLLPLTVTGTPEELSEGYFNAVRESLKKASGIIANINYFETALAAKEKAAEEKANEKPKEKKAAGKGKIKVNAAQATIEDTPKPEPEKAPEPEIEAPVELADDDEMEMF